MTFAGRRLTDREEVFLKSYLQKGVRTGQVALLFLRENEQEHGPYAATVHSSQVRKFPGKKGVIYPVDNLQFYTVNDMFQSGEGGTSVIRVSTRCRTELYPELPERGLPQVYVADASLFDPGTGLPKKPDSPGRPPLVKLGPHIEEDEESTDKKRKPEKRGELPIPAFLGP